MIGSLTTVAVVSSQLGPTLEQMCWSQTEERYRELRGELVGMLEEIELEGVEVPADQAGFSDDYREVQSAITAHLSKLRGRVGGDVVGLPIFFLTSFSFRAVIHISLGERDDQLVEFVEECLEDLGLKRDLARVLEREAGRIVLEQEGDEKAVRYSDVISAGGAFVVRVLEEFQRTLTDAETFAPVLAAMQVELADFRAEYRATSAHLAALVSEGNAKVVEALGEVKAALIVEGQLDPGEAKELTEGEPEEFWERLMRWFGGGEARGAAEAALWAALDFAPGGTGIKLGIKVAGAIRGALKASVT